MLNRSASLTMSTCVLKALPGKRDIKRHSPSILYLYSTELKHQLIPYMYRQDTRKSNHGFLLQNFIESVNSKQQVRSNHSNMCHTVLTKPDNTPIECHQNSSRV